MGFMYFVHSYSAFPIEEKNIAATTKYGTSDVTALVWYKNTGACQFHPEKSGNAGQKMTRSVFVVSIRASPMGPILPSFVESKVAQYL